MNLRRSLRFLPLAALAACGLFSRPAPAPPPAKMFIDAAGYKFGDNRAALSAIADEVRESQSDPARRPAARAGLVQLLGSKAIPDSTPEAKQFACRQLAIVGTEAEVPAIAKLLGDPATADSARYALERIPGPEACMALRAALKKSSGVEKIGVVNSIGERRDAPSLRALKPLASGPDDDLALAAIAAIGKLGDPAAAAALGALEKSAPEARRAAIGDALIQCGGLLIDSGKKAEAEAIFERLSAPERPPQVRAAAIRGLAATRGPQAAPQVASLFAAEDRRLRRAAITLAREMPGETASTLALVERMNSLPVGGQAALIDALAERGDRAALPAIIAATKSPDRGVRIAALQALGRLGDASTVMILARESASPDAETAKAARASLAALRFDGALPAIIEDLKIAPPALQIELIRSLGERRASQASLALMALAASPDPEIRAAAYKALTLAGDPAILGSLASRLGEETSPSARAEAESAVIAVALRVADPARRAEPVLKTLDECGAEAKPPVVHALGKIGGDAALARLRAASAGENAAEREAAIAALGGWADDSPADDLLKIAKTSRIPADRAAAFAGYSGLVARSRGTSDKLKAAKLGAALKLAKSPDEKRGIIAALGGIPALDALKLVEPHYDSAPLRGAAIESGSKTAFAICGHHPNEAKASMERALKLAPDAKAKEGATLVLETVKKLDGYITAWQVSGPYVAKKKKTLFEEAFPPEDASAQGVEWKAMPPASDPARPWVMNLLNAIGGDNRAAYLRTFVWSNGDQPARLELGSDDGVRAWLNGALVHSNNASRSVAPGEDVVQVSLKKGWNTLLLKVVNGGSDWGACARLRSPGGEAIQGLRAQAEPAK